MIETLGLWDRDKKLAKERERKRKICKFSSWEKSFFYVIVAAVDFIISVAAWLACLLLVLSVVISVFVPS